MEPCSGDDWAAGAGTELLVRAHARIRQGYGMHTTQAMPNMLRPNSRCPAMPSPTTHRATLVLP